MNEQLQERFGRSRRAFKEERSQVELWAMPQKLNLKVREYFEEAKKAVDGGPWLDRLEIPSSKEVLDTETESTSSSDSVEITPNRPKGAWESKEVYLAAQYELLREDAVRPLRIAVAQVKFTPMANEDAFNGAIGIYDKVHICSVTCSSRGIAIRVTFSIGRTGKLILWDQSKRLISGSLVVLTPRDDMFQTKAIVATVAARPLAALEQNPPEIDLFIARAEEHELDPAQEFVMVEDRGGLYEAHRHTLLALQRMMREPFPLSEHLVDVESTVLPPQYVQLQPKADMTKVFINNKHETYENVDLLKWPNQPASDLDASQLAALRRILTKRLAIIQGPPGTGKTHVSVQAIKVLLANRKPGDPPIIIACQTNHAVDQILRHIAEFEKEFIRLGGRSKDQDVIKARTLYAVRNQEAKNPLPGSLAQNARKRMKQMEKEFGVLLSPLHPGKLPLDFRTLQNLGLLSEKQANSLEEGASQWVQGSLSNPQEAHSPFTIWLGKSLIPVPPKQMPEEFGFDYEEADLEFEQLKELEAENVAKDDEDFESLSGARFSIADNFTCRKKESKTEQKAQEMLKEENMWKIPEADRPTVYRYLQSEAKKMILTDFRKKIKAFNEQAALRKIGNWEQDENILKNQKVIGMTTTGLSKYRGLLAALEPKIVLIEEAAETLEAPVTVACLPSLGHLILVGDHQQLRPHCHVKAHEDKPYYLNISLFERLVKNNVEFSTLSKQRRMIPEIRRILHPIYRDLIKDHQSVLDPAKRPSVPGMGGVNSFFFTHQWAEQRDEQMSAFNQTEATMIVGFYEYLVYNGMQAEEITVLTFYNGQRKRILKQLRDCPTLVGRKFTVVTVDSYQGEENKVVLLSLVRSNENNQIGFLNVENRVCVALSRAQCGFYIFGNGRLLYEYRDAQGRQCRIWKKVLEIIANQGPMQDRLKAEPLMRVEAQLTVRCSNHNNKTVIKDPDDFEIIVGGCTEKCNGDLPCGHPCELRCHPFSHDEIKCQQPCMKALPCGHMCSCSCGETCSCNICTKERGPLQITNVPFPSESDVFDGKETLSKASSSASWNSFAASEPVRYAAAASATPSHSNSPQRKEDAKPLLDLQTEDITENVQQLTFALDGHHSPTEFIEEKVVANGTRTRRKEKFIVKAGKSMAESKEDWSKKESLLD